MSFRATAAMAGVLAVLCAVYFSLDFFKGRRTREAEAAKLLFGFTAAEVIGLRVQPVDAPAAAAARPKGGAWSMTQPNATIRPLQPLWDRMAGHFAAMSNERTLGATDNLAQYGLDTPALEATASLDGGGEHRIAFGFEEPTRSYRYARLDDGPVFLVKTDAFFELNRPLDELRHRFLVDDRDAAIVRIEFARIWTGRANAKIDNPPAPGTESVRIVAVREDAGSPWRLAEPVEAAADQALVEGFANEVQFGAADGFVDAPQALSAYGLDPPVARITVNDDRTGAHQTLFLGEPDEADPGRRLWARREGQDAVFRVDPMLGELLPRAPTAWRNRRLFDLEMADVASLTYTARGAAPVVVNKTPEGLWQLAEPAEPAEQLVVSSLLGGLKDMQGTGFPEGTMASLGLEDPDFAIALRRADGSGAEARFLASPRDPNFHYATQADGTVVLVESTRAQGFRMDRAAFKSRTVLRFDPRQVRRFAFTLDGTRYALELVHTRWVLREPAGAALSNQSDADAIVKALATLSGPAVDPALAADAARTGLGAPVFTFEATLAAPDGTESTAGPLHVGNPVEDDPARRYAKTAGNDGIYRIKQETLETVREALRGFNLAPPAAAAPPAA